MNVVRFSEELRSPFKVTTVELLLPELPDEFLGYRIVQLTDLHFGPLTPATHIEHAVQITTDLTPDLVVLTGDYVQFSGTGIRHMLATRVHPKMFRWNEYRRQVRSLTRKLSTLLDPLVPVDGILAVFGNHDYNEGLGTIRRQLPQRITWLTNSFTKVVRGSHHLLVAGLDDHRRGKPNLPKALTFNDSGKPPVARILLAHNPDVTLSDDATLLNNVQLILCGHTHGGQICLPGGHPLATRTKQNRHFAGISDFNGTPVYVSNGIGYGGLGMRLFCRPEITLVKLGRM